MIKKDRIKHCAICNKMVDIENDVFSEKNNIVFCEKCLDIFEKVKKVLKDEVK